MIYICVAFKEEAKPLLALWQFKRNKSAPCKLYVSDKIYLVITQMGQENASKAIRELLLYLPPKQNDVFINFGICAAPKNFAIGDVLECSSIAYKKETLKLHSKFIPSRGTYECKLTTLDAPTSSEYDTAVDMEAFALFKITTTSSSLTAHVFQKNYCIKVVSDHFEPLHVDRKNLTHLLSDGVAKIKEIVDENCHSDRN